MTHVKITQSAKNVLVHLGTLRLPTFPRLENQPLKIFVKVCQKWKYVKGQRDNYPAERRAAACEANHRHCHRAPEKKT